MSMLLPDRSCVVCSESDGLLSRSLAGHEVIIEGGASSEEHWCSVTYLLCLCHQGAVSRKEKPWRLFDSSSCWGLVSVISLIVWWQEFRLYIFLDREREKEESANLFSFLVFLSIFPVFFRVCPNLLSRSFFILFSFSLFLFSHPIPIFFKFALHFAIRPVSQCSPNLFIA